MTRLTEDDVRGLAARLPEFDAGLRSVAGIDLRTLALRACGLNDADSSLAGVRMAAVPVSSGLGFIPFFSQCVEVILRHIGCDAFVTSQPDGAGGECPRRVSIERPALKSSKRQGLKSDLCPQLNIPTGGTTRSKTRADGRRYHPSPGRTDSIIRLAEIRVVK